ncbi:hypothetical protein [Brevundimonas sp.]|uniref:hypothetical protein n=1 Tax=Brevundimonas sp. TaxID=1871086 RepID=UPI003D113F07
MATINTRRLICTANAAKMETGRVRFEHFLGVGRCDATLDALRRPWGGRKVRLGLRLSNAIFLESSQGRLLR